MIDFTTGQLTWIVIGACTLGGTGYMTTTSSMQSMDKSLAVLSTNMSNQNVKIETLQAQLTRIEEKLDTINRNK
jgi:hypothetical protein